MSTQARPALVGRDPEIAALIEATERAASGGLTISLLEGEAGIGKTSLMAVATEHAESRGFGILRGAGRELARDRPFGPLLDALGLGLSDVSGEPSEHQLAPPVFQTPDLRYRAIEVLVQRVETLTTESPVVLTLDDLQWADPATLAALARIVIELSYAPLAVLAAARPAPRSEELAVFLDEVGREGAGRLRLYPLTDTQLLELAEDALAAPPGPNLRAMLAGTGGNPFIAHEMLAAARHEGLVEGEDQVDSSRADVPEAVRLVILQRLSRLPAEVREVLRLGSVLGTSFSPADLSVFLARPVSELTRPIEEALRWGELMPDGDRIAYRHDIVRQAVYEDMPTGVRSALHLQAARALASAGAPATTVAPHFSLGAAPGDSVAVQWLRRAAREALASDPPAALTLLERAMELGPDPPALAEIRRERLSALLWSGRPDEAIALGEEVLRSGPFDPTGDARIRIALGTAFEAQARWDRALEQFAAVDGADLPPLDQALILAHRAHLALPSGDLDAAAANAEQARRLCQDRPCLALSVALHVQILIADAQARWSDLPNLVRLAEASQDSDPTGEARLWPGRQLGVLLCRADRIEEADAVIRKGVKIAEEIGLPIALHTLLAALAWKELYAGRLDEAETHAETALGFRSETEALSAVVLCLSILARVAIHKGEHDRAQAALETVVQEMSKHPLQYQAQMAMWARALLAEARNEPEAAHGALSSALDLVVSLGWEGEVRDLGPDAVRMAMANGEGRRAEVVASILEGLAEREGLASVRGAALQCRGLVNTDAGMLLDAVEAWRGACRPLDLARALEDAAAALASTSSAADARRLLEEAAGAYETAGAARDLARCEHALRDLGVRRGARGPRRRPSSGWDALTESERRVAELAAEGLTNPMIAERLFVSRHTVKTHLGHAFQKLGVSSRMELVRALAAGRA